MNMIMNASIPFNKPFMTGRELYNLAQANFNGMLAGDGPFTKHCHQWLEKSTGTKKALLTHSCTAALEMSALLLDIQPGDEVIMPSFTFVSTANAFVLRGAVPVFVDIRPDTLNIDEQLIEQAITSKTKAIVPVHYAGVSCEMDTIMDIAAHHNLSVVEDAAQGVMSTYKGRSLGSIGNLGTYSFHETKNIISGEGGALLVNDECYIQDAEIIREKGTDRSRFFRGQVDKYTWQVPGSSYLPGETTAAFLAAQLDEASAITERRLNVWETYHQLFEDLECRELVRRPIIPEGCQHNGHMYYLLLNSRVNRDALLSELKSHGIYCVFHYVPLHSSPGGMKYGRVSGQMNVTDCQSECLIRLPLWVGVSPNDQSRIQKLIMSHVTS
jgi:dTDP-4-amino-4,6-dideoxygalactose transaminase